MNTTLQRTSNSAPPPRPPDAQEVLFGGVYSFILRHLSLDERESRQVEKHFGTPPYLQEMLGYVSGPRPRRIFEKDERTSRWLNALTAAEFLDWFIYSKNPLYPPAKAYELEQSEEYSGLESLLAEHYGPIQHIPGLYFDRITRLKMFRPGSLIVPCRVDGIIRALQLYGDINHGHFCWYSTPHLPGGSSLRASLHVANSHRAHSDRVALIVSHTLEADAEAWKTGECVIAVNGMSPLRLAHAVRDVFPELKWCVVSTEFGQTAVRLLTESGFRVEVYEEEKRHE